MKNELLKNWFASNFESRILGRYVTLNHLESIVNELHEFAKIEAAGISENGVEIPILKIGFGSKKILGWSQMHGNESTTTKGVFDFIKFLKAQDLYKSEIDSFLKTHTFYIIPILNPDGAILNTRENFNKIDLNRDAQNLSQAESRLLRKWYDKIQPDICLNLHDQRSIFGFDTGYAAAISFLAPAANMRCTMTSTRKLAVGYINGAVNLLKEEIPNRIGRFDDSFNINCVGDTFSNLKVPTILIEAGHIGNDYERDSTRYYVFLALTGILIKTSIVVDSKTALKQYLDLPENRKNFNDILLTNVLFKNNKTGSIGCQYREVLVNGTVEFQLFVDEINSKSKIFGHKIYDLQGGMVLINSQENFNIGQKILNIHDVLLNNRIY